MEINELSKKERLIFNELAFKHKVRKEMKLGKIIELHQELIGSLDGKWGEKYTSSLSRSDWLTQVYSLLVYPLAYPSIKVENYELKKIGSFYWSNRIGNKLEKIKEIAGSIGRVLVKKQKKNLSQLQLAFEC